MNTARLKWGQDGLLPAVVQDVRTGQVLMVAYMNRAALDRTLAEGRTVFWSRSRGEFWPKGDTSGHRQYVRAVRSDCDGDAILVLVEQVGVACHTGTYSCFSHELAGGPEPEQPHIAYLPNAPAVIHSAGEAVGKVLGELSDILAHRRRHPEPDSYTSKLFAKGVNASLKKVAEEAGEVLLAAKDRDRAGLIWEVADLWFHSMLVLAEFDISLNELAAELEGRRGRRRNLGGQP